MKFIAPLNTTEIISLQRMNKKHPLAKPRIRASAILQSNEQIPLQRIAKVCGVCRQTASIWLTDWEAEGIEGLLDKTGRGRKKILSDEKEADVIQLVKVFPRSLKKVLSEIQSHMGIKLSISTLKALCRKANLSWKRVRKSLRGKRNEEDFRKALEEIKCLMEQADKEEIGFYYFDESGFTLEPCVPYAWQEKGKTIEIPSSKSNRLNVLGFIDRQCCFESYIFEGSINSDVVIECFNAFAKKLDQKTVVVIDNASMHTSHAFLDNIDRWKEQNLYIQNIPPYSPELNKIEILWKKIKYEWLDFSAYKSFASLKEKLNHILANIGKDYHIQFT